MNNINSMRLAHEEALKRHCQEQGIDFGSVQRLLKAERTKKLLKRNALMQTHIDKEIDNAISHAD